MDGISANDLFQANAFYKGYNGKHTEGFFTTLMCQCFIKISFKFANAKLYVTDNGILSLS